MPSTRSGSGSDVVGRASAATSGRSPAAASARGTTASRERAVRGQGPAPADDARAVRRRHAVGEEGAGREPDRGRAAPRARTTSAATTSATSANAAGVRHVEAEERGGDRRVTRAPGDVARTNARAASTSAASGRRRPGRRRRT